MTGPNRCRFPHRCCAASGSRPAAILRRRSTASRSGAPTPRCPRPSGSARRRRPPSPPPAWPRPRSGGCARAAARPLPSTCGMRPSSFAASATCALTASRREPAWDKIAGVYDTGDGRKVRLHTNFPHHRDGMLKLLGCAYDREAVQRALLKWQAEPFETAAAAAGLVATMTALAGRMGGAPPGPGGRGAAAHRDHKIGEAPPGRLPPQSRAAAVGACACSTSPASSPGRCAAARWRRTAPT